MPRTRLLPALLGAITLITILHAPVAHGVPIEDYATYQPQSRCSPTPKPGMVYLGRWIVRKYGGGVGPISRRCGSATSEHSEGRAFDWTVSARRAADRTRVDRLLERLFRTDASGNPDAWARRMGIMYVIWNDHMWSAWDGFRRERYLSSSCTSRRRCSATLRHRDHLHISLNRAGGKGRTSWFAGRLD
ncbi:MAG: hypothetical protein M3237_22080 [Actinomycetota bacterium]|nr:hypothetical protein [Actinomycetota bacterium]